MSKQTGGIDIHLNTPQWNTINSTARETFLIGGVGMGKSYLLAYLSFRALCIKGAVVLLAAPTIKTLRNATLKQVQNGWADLGFFENEHYVINRRPPLRWGIKPFSSLSSHSALTTKWGSYAVLDGLDNFNSHRGSEFDEIFIDELRDTDPEARLVLIGRLRGKTYTRLGFKHRAWYATTPPENPTMLQSIVDSKGTDIKVIWGTSYDNADNLPEPYISNLKLSYDEKTFEREVLGKLVFLNSNPFFYSFVPPEHVGPTQADPRHTLTLSFDFNVNPLTCIAVQAFGNKVSVLREWRLEGSDIFKLAAQIRPFMEQFRSVEITGDATGMAKSALVRDNIPAYIILLKELGLRDSSLRLAKANPPHSNSIIICNSVISRIISLKIDPSCKYLIEDLKAVSIGPNNKISIDNPKQGHLMDCFRYYLHNYWGHTIPKSSYERAKQS